MSIGTTLVTFLVVGVVDYAVHLLSRIRMLVQKGIEIDEAILAAMQGVGRSTVVNVVIFSMGFVALLFCAYKPVIDLGVLVILALSSGGFISILLVTLISPWFFAAIVPQPAVQEGEQPGGLCQAKSPGRLPAENGTVRYGRSGAAEWIQRALSRCSNWHCI